jgi:hypothetical protein
MGRPAGKQDIKLNRRDDDIRIEFNSGRNDGFTAMTLINKISKKYRLKIGTIKKIIYDSSYRNPIQTA